MKKPYFISLAIPYVNAAPHIGHILEHVQGDAVARYQRLVGKDVFFLFGSDENSLKNVQAAEKAGQPVAEFVEQHAKHFSDLKQSLNLSIDDFIRTTEKRHILGAQKLWSQCKPEDIYKKRYKGLYCVGCEAFYTEDELENGLCPEHKRPPEVVEEENYFFKLSNYQKQIEKLIASDTIRLVPDSKKNEMLAFVGRGLEDFSISRSRERAHGWGVPVPGDESQIMYVWFDALSNYINALDFGGDQKLFKKYWVQKGKDREVVHVIGKGIARFHAIYWIGMLLSAGIPLPTEEFVHGYVTVNGEKISKSLGNVIDPHDVITKYGVDPVRFYLLGAIPSYGDGDFSEERFEKFYTAELVNGIGNLTSRILTMLEKYCDNKIPKVKGKVPDHFITERYWKEYQAFLAEYKFDAVVAEVSRLAKACDTAITEKKPWEAAKKGEDISVFLYQLAETLRHIALGLLPIIPASAEKILAQLGVVISDLKDLDKEKKWGGLKAGSAVKKGDILFPRLEKKV